MRPLPLTRFGELLQGFQYHVKNDHNMWAYLFFFIHLRSIKETDYTTLELYIHKQVNYCFIVHFKTSNHLLAKVGFVFRGRFWVKSGDRLYNVQCIPNLPLNMKLPFLANNDNQWVQKYCAEMFTLVWGRDRNQDSFQVFVNNATLTILTYLTYLSVLCFNLGEIISCMWDTFVF